LTLDQLIRRTRIQRDVIQTTRRVLEGVFPLLHARTLVWVPPQPDGVPLVLGEPCVTPADCAHLAAGRTRTAAGAPDTVFGNDLPKVWADGLPGVPNLLALPVPDHGLPAWVIAINKRTREREAPKPRPDLDSSSFVPSPFRRSDAALLTP